MDLFCAATSKPISTTGSGSGDVADVEFAAGEGDVELENSNIAAVVPMPVLPPDGVKKSVVEDGDASGEASSGAGASSSGEDSSGVASDTAMTSGGS